MFSWIVLFVSFSRRGSDCLQVNMVLGAHQFTVVKHFRGNAKSELIFLVRGDHHQFLKKRSENAGANENLSGGFAAILGIAPRVAPRIVGFVFKIKS